MKTLQFFPMIKVDSVSNRAALFHMPVGSEALEIVPINGNPHLMAMAEPNGLRMDHFATFALPDESTICPAGKTLTLRPLGTFWAAINQPVVIWGVMPWPTLADAPVAGNG